MKETLRAPVKAGVISVLTVGMLSFLLRPPDLSGATGLIVVIAGAVTLALLVAWGTVALMGEGPDEREFEEIVRRSEALARMPAPDAPPTDFDVLVVDAIDRLPREFQELLEVTPVVVSCKGREHRAYGQYMGDTVAREGYPDRILIFQDTLERDFGHDPDLLRSKVEQTLQHEVAHHLGWGEREVRDLGL